MLQYYVTYYRNNFHSWATQLLEMESTSCKVSECSLTVEHHNPNSQLKLYNVSVEHLSCWQIVSTTHSYNCLLQLYQETKTKKYVIDIPFFPEILVKYRSSDHLKNKYLKWWAPQLQVPVAAVSGTNNKKVLKYENIRSSDILKNYVPHLLSNGEHHS